MRQSVYVLTALFAGITLGVLAGELRSPTEVINAGGTEPPAPEPLPPEEPRHKSPGAAMITIPSAAMAPDTMQSLLEEIQRAALERQALVARHEALQAQMERLEEKLSLASDTDTGARETPPADPGLETSQATSPPAESEDRELQALLDAGFDTHEAAEIKRRAGETEMQRLYLRDRAVREGWFGSERYREELEALESPDDSLRAQWGDQAFDRYLYASGESNRIRVDSVINASPAATAGLEPGDFIYRYADQRVFSTADLRSAMADGEAGETVLVEVSRGGSRRSFYLSRGPLGVHLRPARVEP